MPQGNKAEGSTRILTRPVLEWAAWDWGSAAFNAIATTFVFSIYLVSDGLFTDKDIATQYLSLGMTIAGLVIAALAPVTGQRADRGGRGGLRLAIYTYAVVVCMLLMFFVAPQSPLGNMGALILGITLLGLGNIFFELASVNYNAMLNYLATKKNVGRISAIGWGSGYVGGIVLLIILFVGFISPEVGWFGVTKENGLNIRVAMVFAAVWFALSALPVVMRPPQPKVEHQPERSESIAQSYKRLWETIRTLAKEAPQTLFFLVSSAIFRDGLAGVFTFGAILAGTAFGFSDSEIIIFGVASNVVAGVATILMGTLDDIFGPKRLMEISLICMIASGMGVFFFASGGKVVFWVLGLILCIFVGPVQSASRSFLSRMIPEGREGEVFGLYATTGRAVSFLAPALFSLFVFFGRSFGGGEANATVWGILGIMIVLFIGLVMLIPIRESEAHLNVEKN